VVTNILISNSLTINLKIGKKSSKI